MGKHRKQVQFHQFQWKLCLATWDHGRLFTFRAFLFSLTKFGLRSLLNTVPVASIILDQSWPMGWCLFFFSCAFPIPFLWAHLLAYTQVHTYIFLKFTDLAGFKAFDFFINVILSILFSIKGATLALQSKNFLCCFREWEKVKRSYTDNHRNRFWKWAWIWIV